MVQRSLPFLLLAGLVSCKGDPTGDLRNGTDHLIATPTSLFVGVGADSSKFVVVSAVDEQGNLLSENFRLGAVTGPFTVTEDPTYIPLVDKNGNLEPQKNPTSARYIVKPTANTGSGNFSVSAGGRDITIPIRMLPAQGVITLSNINPPLGDTVTATLEPGLVFTSSSAITVAGGIGAVKTGLSADSTKFKFLVGPGASASTVTISGVRLTYAPVLGPLNAVAPSLTTVAAPVISAFSGTTPNVNDLVTVTAPAGVVFPPETRVYFGADRQVVTNVAGNGASLTFRAHKTGPSGTITFANATVTQLPQIPLRLLANVAVNVGATITPLTGTGAIATAPEIVAADVDETSGVIDQGATVASADCGAVGNHCLFYKLVLDEDQTLKFTFTWGNTADIGGYFLDAGGNDVFGDFACDAHGSGATAQPESCTEDFVAGTYYVAVADFTAAAQNTSFTILIERQ